MKLNKDFKESSKTERILMSKLLNKKGITNIYFTNEIGYAKFEGLFTNSKGEEIIFEVKNRKNTSTFYNETIIEKTKFDFLLSSGITPYIFIFFTDNKVLIHKLDRNNKYKEKIYLAPKTTDGDNTKINKVMIKIEIKKEELYNYE
jgi:hypothetical protein